MVAIGSLGLSESLNQRVPLLDESAELVSGDVEAVEVGVAIVALNLLALNANLSPGELVGFLLKITERDLENATTEGVSGNFYNTPTKSAFEHKRANFRTAK